LRGTNEANNGYYLSVDSYTVGLGVVGNNLMDCGGDMKYFIWLIILAFVFEIGAQVGMRKMRDDRDWYRSAYQTIAGTTGVQINPLTGKVEEVEK